ncbi:MAG: MBL fold metallo-hydrolase [Oscillibacter sp.]|nr:MBL fold metallo-hydrolase [Oscillibacter sp.]
MLLLHFINVGDGDAVLVEEKADGRVFRLLVDAGREDVGTYPGSLRRTAAAYLRERGIHRLDAVVITHLHIDHFGGLSALRKESAVGAVWSGFFPCLPSQEIVRTGMEEKTVSGLMDCLERWAEDAAALAAEGCLLYQVEETLRLDLSPRLRVEIICGDRAASARQRAVWTALLSGKEPDQDMVWWSSKFRNPGSLRVRLEYAGRRIELAGDCYGAVWEDRAEPCDIFKVPHHGDAKSVTPRLVRNLRPEHAVISCQAAYIPRKDRPSMTAVRLLGGQGARVWFTDGFAPPGWEPDRWTSVDFTIREDGTILPPEPST